jgi:hypothetical protein
MATWLLLLAGCGEAPPAPEITPGRASAAQPGPVEVPTPDGFTVYEGPGYGFAWPAGWKQIVAAGAFTDGADVEIVGPSGKRGLPPLITAYSEEGFSGGFDRYYFDFNVGANTSLPDRTVVNDDPTTVAHAIEARLIEVEYTVPGLAAPPAPGLAAPKRAKPTEKEEPVVVRQVDLIVLTAGGSTIDLRVAAPVEDFARLSSRFTAVLESFRVSGPTLPEPDDA